MRKPWSPEGWSMRWKRTFAGTMEYGQLDGGSTVGMAAAPSSSSPSGESLKAWMAGNGLWKVAPPSRLNDAVMRSVASSNDSRRTMGPVIASGSMETTKVTGGSWLPSGKTRVNWTEKPSGRPALGAVAASMLLTVTPVASMTGLVPYTWKKNWRFAGSSVGSQYDARTKSPRPLATSAVLSTVLISCGSPTNGTVTPGSRTVRTPPLSNAVPRRIDQVGARTPSSNSSTRSKTPSAEP